MSRAPILARAVRPAAPAPARAFTFIEIMIVVVVIGIIAAVVVPRFGNVSDQARTTALQSVLGGVRASISAYRTRTVITGAAQYPSLAQLTTPGTVVESDIEPNPFTGVRGVRAVTAAQAAARAVGSTAQYGWNYYVDNTTTPPQAIFYANSTTATTATNSSGAVQAANQL